MDNGCVKVNQEVAIVNHHEPDKMKKVKISKLYEFDGLNKVDVKEAGIGSIVAISGIADIHIGDTLCSPDNPVPIPFQKISEPTIAMHFIVNDSPLAGREGKYVTSRHLRDRLFRELNTDVSLRVEETDTTESFKVSGRGELHLSVLIENMRREGYEFAVSKAEVLYKTDENGKKLEPMELIYVDVPEEFSGTVIEKLSQRKGELLNMGAASGNYTRLEFSIPSRGLIGYRGEFMTDTKGNGIMNSSFNGYGPYKGDIQYRKQGSLIAFEAGEAITYGLYNAQERGTLFIGPGEKVYSGMVVGQNSRGEDIELNVCKKKQLTNTRSSSADEALRLTPPKVLSLEQALEFIDTDELLEVTPSSLRIRKKILDPTMRKRASFSPLIFRFGHTLVNAVCRISGKGSNCGDHHLCHHEAAQHVSLIQNREDVQKHMDKNGQRIEIPFRRVASRRKYEYGQSYMKNNGSNSFNPCQHKIIRWGKQQRFHRRSYHIFCIFGNKRHITVHASQRPDRQNHDHGTGHGDSYYQNRFDPAMAYPIGYGVFSFFLIPQYGLKCQKTPCFFEYPCRQRPIQHKGPLVPIHKLGKLRWPDQNKIM